jgi:TDG/mug DNA glycosylase family protein
MRAARALEHGAAATFDLALALVELFFAIWSLVVLLNALTLKARVMTGKHATKREPFKPTKEQLAAAYGKTVPDVIAHDLRVLFCGINPGLYTAAVGHHFARPGNRFWPALHRSGFTSSQLSPFDEDELLLSGVGITNVVARATATAAELTKADFIEGGRKLGAKVRRYQPKILAVLGVGAYRHAFDRPKAVIGPQEELIHRTQVWVLPNPSGLNANYQIGDLVKLFQNLRRKSIA